MVFAGRLFDFNHLIYILCSVSLTVISLMMAYYTLTSQVSKDRFLRFWATLSLFLHTSILWVDYLRYGEVLVPSYFLFPTFLCNVTLALLVALAYWPESKGKFFHTTATFTAYSGVISGLLAMFYPMYYLQGPSIFEWSVFKSLTSHTAMMIGCFYLFVGRYVRVKKIDGLIFALGLAVCGLMGLATNALFYIAGLPSPNAMFLDQIPVEVPGWFNVYVLALMLVALVTLFSAYLYPTFNRWISNEELTFIPLKKRK